MKNVHYLAKGLTLAVIFGFTLACRSDTEINAEKVDDTIVTPSGFTFFQKGQSVDFSISCAGAWRLEEVIDPNGTSVPIVTDVRDFTVAPVSGNGNAKVTITLKNDLTENYDFPLKVVTATGQVIIKLKASANQTKHI